MYLRPFKELFCRGLEGKAASFGRDALHVYLVMAVKGGKGKGPRLRKIKGKHPSNKSSGRQIRLLSTERLMYEGYLHRRRRTNGHMLMV